MEVQNELVVSASQIANIELLPNRRKVTFDFLGCPLSKDVASLQEEVYWKVTCTWKAAAVAHGQFPRLWLEAGKMTNVVCFVFKCNLCMFSFLSS